MKKILLGSSAIAGLAFAAGAQAADPIQIGISGNLESSLTTFAIGGDNIASRSGVAGNKDSSIQFSQDWDLTFTGKTTLENGLTVGVYLQLNQTGANGGTAGEDEVYAIVSGGFGEFRIGQDDDVTNDTFGDFIVTGGSLFDISSSDAFEVTLAQAGASGQTVIDQDLSIGDNIATIWYRTPRFAGFRLSASYSPDDSSPGDSTTQADNALEDIFALGVEYENSFGGIDLGIFAAAGVGNETGTNVGGNAAGSTVTDTYNYTAGVKVGFAGFEIGGGYAQKLETGSMNRTASLGVSYSIDKVKVGISGAYGREDNVDSLSTAASAGQDTGYAIQLDGSYAMGPGITFGAGIGWTDISYAAGDNDETSGDVSGLGFGTSLNIKF